MIFVIIEDNFISEEVNSVKLLHKLKKAIKA